MRPLWKCTAAVVAVGASILIGSATIAPAADATNPASRSDATARARAAYVALPLSFEANQGQTDSRVTFLARGAGYGVYLTSTEAVLTLGKAAKGTAGIQDIPRLRRIESQVVRMTLVGANPEPRIEGRDALAGRTNYFVGNDRTKWRTNIPTYARVTYEAVYPGVDLVYYGNQRQLEYDFVVAPGTDPRVITLSFAGARDMRVDGDGALVLSLADGELRQHAPVVYQDINGVRKPVPGRYVINEKRLVAFDVGPYDASRPLVIDPTLAYSTYLGGSGDDGGQGIAVDAAGNAYVTGFTLSLDFPTTAGAHDTAFGGVSDAFVTKLNPAGSALIYSTYLGGTFGIFGGQDGGGTIAVDASGNVYIAGGTESFDFPIVNGFQTFVAGNFDGFVAKLNPTGSTLLYSSYIGGGGNDGTTGIAVDNAGNAYVSGLHNSGNSFVPRTTNAFEFSDPSAGCPGGGFTGFVIKVNTNGVGWPSPPSPGGSLLYASHLSGAGQGTNAATGIAVDSAGNVYVSGATSSLFFPTTPGAYQPSFNGTPACFAVNDAYVVKLNPAPATCTPGVVNGTFVNCIESLVYGTYLGGSLNDGANGIAIDAAGNAYVTGVTDSLNFPTTPGAPQTVYGGGGVNEFDAFVTKLNSTGSALHYSTYLGGSGDDQGTRVAVDTSGNAYVTGRTNSLNFPTTPDALQPANAGGQDAFVTKLNAAGTAPLVFSTYLGGTLNDQGSGIAVDSAGNVYVAGTTNSVNFPTTPGAFQPANAGLNDAFVTKIGFAPPLPTTKDQCKNGGWQTFGVFKNQGDCVSFVATGGKNQPH